MKKVLLAVLAILLIGGIYLFLNRDMIVYVGSVDIIEVDCARTGEILDEVYETDQGNRRGDVPFSKWAKDDHHNQELVISIIEKCGMPTLDEVSEHQMNALWLVLQHSDHDLQKKYWPQVKQAVENGDLKKSQYALMKDRLLMSEGKPQLYGSQIYNGKLYKLADPDSVDHWRAEMGMEPLADYLRRFGIN